VASGKTSTSLRVAILAVLAAAGCGRNREKEPNDHYSQATRIRAGSRVQGTMGSASDVDWFSLEAASQGGVLSAHVTGIRDVDFILSVFDAERRELKRFDETASGGDERALDIGLPPGTAYVVLKNKNAKAADHGQSYALTLKLEPGQGREREPDDRAPQAAPLEPGGVVKGHYYPSRNLLSDDTGYAEQDWYSLDVGSDGLKLLNIDVSEVPKVAPILEVYDSNLYKLREVSAGPGEALTLKGFGIKGPARYYVALRSRSQQAANADVPYEFLTELIPYRGTREFEPNDQRLDATPFEQDSIEGTMAPAGDADWYRVAVQGDGKQILAAQLSALEKMDLKLTVANDLGQPILEVDNTGAEQPESLTGLGAAPGDIYLVVSEKTGRKADPKKTYTLTKTLTPSQPGLEYELNDGSSPAQGLEVGRSVDGYFAPRGDVDFYEFNVYVKTSVSIELSGVLNVRPRLTLSDPSSQVLQEAAARKAGEGLSLSAVLDPGTYILRLKAEDPGQNNVRDKYTLRLKAQG